MKDVSLKQKLRRGGAVLLVTMVCLTGLVGCNPDKAAAGGGSKPGSAQTDPNKKGGLIPGGKITDGKNVGGKDAGSKDNGGKGAGSKAGGGKDAGSKAGGGKGAGSKDNGGKNAGKNAGSKDTGNKDNGGKPKPPVTGKAGGKSGN